MKNKILLATAVAVACGAPVAAMADANIYGQLRYSINSMDSDTATDPLATGVRDGLSGEDNVSLFGLKASVGDDVKAFVHLQTGAAADGNGGRAFNQRFYFGGLKGGFGTVAYGRMTNAYKMPGFKLDPFYNMSHVGAGGTLQTGLATYGLSPATNGFTDNAVQYTSPAMAGLKVNVGMYVDDSNEDDHGSNVGVSYSAGGLNAGIQMASNAKTAQTVPGVIADGDAMRIHGGYKGGNWSAGLSYEVVDLSATTDANYMYLVGKYSMSKETELVLSMGSVSDGPTAGTGYNGAVFQTVAPKTQVYVMYSAASLDAARLAVADNPLTPLVDETVTAIGESPSVFSVGAIHKF